ncbi:MAG: DUF2461 domain-containing protein [Thermodesulfobacteriota bacterium]
MNSISPFTGFSSKTLAFFKDLTADNSKTWFDQNRERYEQEVLVPARDFVSALGQQLKKIAPGIQADPRINKSIFRLNRDIRFSHDKTPYKSHLGIWFWEGSRPRMECSGFYFHLEPGRFMLGAGLYQFPKDMVDPYRRSVVHPLQGPALAKAVESIKKRKEHYIGGEKFKKIPAGYDSGHPLASYLLFGGLYAGVDLPISKKLFSGELVLLCFEHYSRMLPLHRWLLDLTRRAC